MEGSPFGHASGLHSLDALALIAFPSSDPGTGDIDLDYDFVEFSVPLEIAGNVADGVEAAHFLRDLGKNITQVEKIPAGLVEFSTRDRG